MDQPSVPPRPPDATVPVIVPDWGAAVPGVVSGWLVEDGVEVMQGERIVEVLVQAVLIDVVAPASGRCYRYPLPVDARVTAGDVLGEIIISPASPTG